MLHTFEIAWSTNRIFNESYINSARTLKRPYCVLFFAAALKKYAADFGFVF